MWVTGDSRHTTAFDEHWVRTGCRMGAEWVQDVCSLLCTGCARYVPVLCPGLNQGGYRLSTYPRLDNLRNRKRKISLVWGFRKW